MINSNDFTARALVFKALAGSHNYNLNNEKSDKDYKLFVFPTFDDIYNKTEYNLNQTSTKEDYTVHDIRKLPELLWKGNLNFIEMLYSTEYQLPPHNENNWGPAIRIFDFMKEHKNDLATMNLPELYNSALGMGKKKQKEMFKNSPARKISFENFGYDPKNACHAIRCLDFLVRLYENNLNVESAFRYKNAEPEKQLLINVKSGQYSAETCNALIFMKRSQIMQFEKFYTSYPKNEKLYEEFKQLVKNNIRSYLYITELK